MVRMVTSGRGGEVGIPMYHGKKVLRSKVDRFKIVLILDFVNTELTEGQTVAEQGRTPLPVDVYQVQVGGESGVDSCYTRLSSFRTFLGSILIHWYGKEIKSS